MRPSPTGYGIILLLGMGLDVGYSQGAAPMSLGPGVARGPAPSVTCGTTQGSCLSTTVGICSASTFQEVPDNQTDEDGDGILLVTVGWDPGTDSTFCAYNELTTVAVGWNASTFVIHYDYTIETNALVWYLDTGLGGGVTNFYNYGYFPSNVQFETPNDINFVMGMYGDKELSIRESKSTGPASIPAGGGEVCRRERCNNGSAGKGAIRIAWSTLYAELGGKVPVGAKLKLAAIIRASDNGAPADVSPNQSGSGTLIQTLITLPLDVNGDGSPDADYALRLGDQDQDGETLYEGDCDDQDPGQGGPGTWYVDADLDGFGDEAQPWTSCTAPAPGDTYADVPGDCDDTDPTVYPGALELCDGQDNGCDAGIDEDCPPPPTPTPTLPPPTPTPTLPPTPTVIPVTPTSTALPTAAPTVPPLTPTPAHATPTQTVAPATPTTTAAPATPTATAGPSPETQTQTQAPSTPTAAPTAVPTSVPTPVDPTPLPTPPAPTPLPTPPPTETPTATAPLQAQDQDGDGFTEAQGDCSDLSASQAPGVLERCDGLDNDCNGLIDDGVEAAGGDLCLAVPGIQCTCSQAPAVPAPFLGSVLLFGLLGVQHMGFRARLALRRRKASRQTSTADHYDKDSAC